MILAPFLSSKSSGQSFSAVAHQVTIKNTRRNPFDACFEPFYKNLGKGQWGVQGIASFGLDKWYDYWNT
jgi:hypothetical protein